MTTLKCVNLKSANANVVTNVKMCQPKICSSGAQNNEARRTVIMTFVVWKEGGVGWGDFGMNVHTQLQKLKIKTDLQVLYMFAAWNTRLAQDI